MSRDTVWRFFQSFGWLAKWVIAPVVLGALLIAGAVLLSRQEIDFDTFLNYFALGLLIFVVITLFYGIIAIHDIPYEIAKKRNHPHQDAIHAAGWVSLFTLHALWPFLWIWAMVFRADRGWGFKDSTDAESSRELDDLLRRVQQLEARSKRNEPIETKKKHNDAATGAGQADASRGEAR
jgi:uncharacterized protein DUF3302